MVRAERKERSGLHGGKRLKGRGGNPFLPRKKKDWERIAWPKESFRKFEISLFEFDVHTATVANDPAVCHGGSKFDFQIISLASLFRIPFLKLLHIDGLDANLFPEEFRTFRKRTGGDW